MDAPSPDLLPAEFWARPPLPSCVRAEPISLSFDSSVDHCAITMRSLLELSPLAPARDALAQLDSGALGLEFVPATLEAAHHAASSTSPTRAALASLIQVLERHRRRCSGQRDLLHTWCTHESFEHWRARVDELLAGLPWREFYYEGSWGPQLLRSPTAASLTATHALSSSAPLQLSLASTPSGLALSFPGMSFLALGLDPAQLRLARKVRNVLGWSIERSAAWVVRHEPAAAVLLIRAMGEQTAGPTPTALLHELHALAARLDQLPPEHLAAALVLARTWSAPLSQLLDTLPAILAPSRA